MISVSNKDFEHLAGFKGAGNPDGNYWFIGLEEGVKGEKGPEFEARLEREIKIRSKWQEIEDLHQMRRSINETMKTGPWTWRGMASMKPGNGLGPEPLVKPLFSLVSPCSEGAETGRKAPRCHSPAPQRMSHPFRSYVYAPLRPHCQSVTPRFL